MSSFLGQYLTLSLSSVSCFTQAFLMTWLLSSSLQGCCLGHTGCHWASVASCLLSWAFEHCSSFPVISMAPQPWGLHRSQISSSKNFTLLGKNSSNCSSCEHLRSPCFVYSDPGLPPIRLCGYTEVTCRTSSCTIVFARSHWSPLQGYARVSVKLSC